MIRHIITSEYPPQPGGVSDYTRIVAKGLAAAGETVHVWCPRIERGDLTSLSDRASQLECSHATEDEGDVKSPHSKVVVHRDLCAFTPRELRRVARKLDQFPAPRRVLVQWVPHGYGYRSMNLAFCAWLWLRARRGDAIELMVHEPSLGFREGSWKHDLVAMVHRLMTIVLLRATRRVWISIPAWEQRLRPYAFGRRVEFRWLPVGSTIPVLASAEASDRLREQYVSSGDALIGHFGSDDAHTTNLLLQSAPLLLKNGDTTLLLLGSGSLRLRSALVARDKSLTARVHATGRLDPDELSRHIGACDLMLQPYIDGVSSRRTTTMTALAHGVPVVTTRGRLTEELWTQSEVVSLAPADDVAAFVECARQLLPNRGARVRLAAAARNFYEQHFQTARTIAALREGLETS